MQKKTKQTKWSSLLERINILPVVKITLFNKLLTNREVNQMENDAYWKVVPIMTTKY